MNRRASLRSESTVKMWRLEKLFVNRAAKGRWCVRRLQGQLQGVPMQTVQDVLEVGAGRGDAAAWMEARHDVRVLGVDVDPDQVELARRLHPETGALRFAVGDATSLDVGDDSIDLVVAQHLFHHLPTWRDAVREIARVLRPGGWLVWLDLAAPPGLAPILSRVPDAGVFTVGEMCKAFDDAGLQATRYVRQWTGPLPHHELVLRLR